MWGKMTKIVYTKWHLANRFTNPDVIELNEALQKYPKIHGAILQHELGHKNTNTTKQDLIHDLSPMSKLSQKDLLIFMFKHPKTLTQFLPFYYSKTRKQFVYDISWIVIYGTMLLILSLLFLLL